MSLDHEKTEFGHDMHKHFLFDSQWVNLNHGSFGTYPRQVRDALRGYQDLTESAVDKFMFYSYIELLDKSRERVAKYINAPVDDCVFVLNATTGIGTVLRNLTWKPKDAIIYFDTVYSAVEKALFAHLDINPHVHIRRVEYTLPTTHSEILNAFSQTISRLLYEGYTPKIALFDSIVSLPGIRLPFQRLVEICKEYSILSVMDAAHAIGQIPLDMAKLDPDFFVSNCHKWLYTPRGCAVFYVPQRNQHLLRTTVPTSHGYIPPPEQKIRRVLPPSGKSGFVELFQFIGTADNSPLYCVPAAMDFRDKVCGGDKAIYHYIRDVAQRGAERLAEILGTEVMDDLKPGERLQRTSGQEWEGGIRDCAMANVLLPFNIAPSEHTEYYKPDYVVIQKDDAQIHVDWLHQTMTDEYNTRVLVYPYKGRLWMRVSGQVYLEMKDFEWFGGVLKDLCQRVRAGESLKTTDIVTEETQETDGETMRRRIEGVGLEVPRTPTVVVSQAGWEE